MLNVIQISRISQFIDHVAPYWDSWVQASAKGSTFQRWAWVESLLHRVHKNAFRGFVVVNTKGIPIAAAAMQKTMLGVLIPVGDGVADYLDIVADPVEANSSIALLVSAMRTSAPAVFFRQCQPDSLIGIYEAKSLVEGESCPLLRLETTDEKQLQAIPKRLRQNLAYAQRSLSKQSTVLYRLTDTNSLSTDVDACIHLHQDRWRRRWMPGTFANTAHRRWFHDVSRRLLNDGALRLHTLNVDGAIVAAVYCFHTHGVTHYYLGGFDNSLHKYSPGMLVTRQAILHAVRVDSAHTFDFLRGNEPYKYRWGAVDRYNQRVILSNNLFGHILSYAEHSRFKYELKLKDRMHQAHGKVSSAKASDLASDKIVE